MARVLIADDVAEECARVLRSGGIEVDHRGKMKPDDLRAAIPSYDGLIVRSAVKVTKEIMEAGPRLKLVGRAGIGVDNIDVEAASRRGVIVMNAPLGNVTSAAEHAFALLLANARHIARADASVRAGKWDRSSNVGVELDGKTLGIVGLGKVGGQVARYGRAFGMRVVAYDPLLVRERAEVLGVELVELDHLLEMSDFITLHLPLTEKTRGLFGAAEFRKMKRSARIVNSSRGGVLDEKALAEALKSGTLAGAALDVFETEPPPKDHPLISLPSATITPHLGASTEEAQLKVSVDIAEQFVDYFRHGVVRNAVNLTGASDPAMRPYLSLAETLGSIAAQLQAGKLKTIEVTFLGQVGGFEISAMTQAAVKGALQPVVGPEVNEVNARFTAREHGLQIIENRRKDARNYKSLVSVRVETDEGSRVVAGTVFEGPSPRVVQIDSFDIDLRPSKHMLVIAYPDVPGMVGRFGTILGNRQINIARMEVGRSGRGQQAIIMLTVDEPVPPEAIEEIRSKVQVQEIRSITLPGEATA
ncbi:MAG TPA: phosphoglycerate dehydrogenase [Planctomycetota bacterium]|nr:phosphoglycerate dehydrogenase [Planctomycetota bacterium]